MALARPGVVNVRTAGAHHAVLDVAAGLRARLLAGTGANLLGQVLTAAIQILSLPLFLHFWSTAQYGKWVMLSAVPAYFSMSDGGVIPVAANRITMLRAAGSPDHADRVFQSALALVVAAIAGIATTSALVLLAMGDGLIDGQSRMALWLLILATLVSLFGGLFEAGFRAFGRYAQGVLWGNGVRLLEFLGLVAGLALGSTFTSAALGALAGRTLGSLVLARHCQHLFPELRWRLDGASGHELRSLLRPAIAYMAFPLGNALSLQALTLLVGGVLGTVAVAIFNTYRTLSRVALQMTSTFSLALWSEFSRLYGARQRLTLEQVFVNGIAWGVESALRCRLQCYWPHRRYCNGGRTERSPLTPICSCGSRPRHSLGACGTCHASCCFQPIATRAWACCFWPCRYLGSWWQPAQSASWARPVRSCRCCCRSRSWPALQSRLRWASSARCAPRAMHHESARR